MDDFSSQVEFVIYVLWFIILICGFYNVRIYNIWFNIVTLGWYGNLSEVLLRQIMQQSEWQSFLQVHITLQFIQ